MFIIILFDIKQLNKLWKKTFKNIHQLSFSWDTLYIMHSTPFNLIF